jgi:hypothetical protein
MTRCLSRSFPIARQSDWSAATPHSSVSGLFLANRLLLMRTIAGFLRLGAVVALLSQR